MNTIKTLVVFVAVLLPCSLMGQSPDTLIYGPTIQLGPDATSQAVVVCPNGFQVVSGGWDGSGFSNNQLSVSRSLPGNNGSLNQWQFTFHNSGSGTTTVKTYAVCRRVFTTSIAGSERVTPEVSELGQNYPNPFNPSTTFAYTITDRSAVRIEVFNESGQLISTLIDGVMESGNFQVSWNGTSSTGSNVSSGNYFYRLTTKGVVQTKKMVLVK